MSINKETLLQVLTKMLGENITEAAFEVTQLKGGTLGDVKLISGVTDGNIPFKLVHKSQKKWESPQYNKDPKRWHREYDFYTSEVPSLFTDKLRPPKCYHAEFDVDSETITLWLEYVEGVSGEDLTIPMLEQLCAELGRFQGKLYANPELRNGINTDCLGYKEYLRECYGLWKPHSGEYQFLFADDVNDEKLLTARRNFPPHLRQWLIDIQNNCDAIFAEIEKFPVVLCHKDLWVENVFYSDEQIVLIDWDTSGWGYLGEDIASLIADEIDLDIFKECVEKLIPAYMDGFSEYADISGITDNHIKEMMVFNFGYRMLAWYIYNDDESVKKLMVDTFQMIFEM